MKGPGRSAPHRGEVTGYLFKLIRESIPLTQEQLAVDLNVDRVTVQSWESGRRPFTAVPLGQAIAVRRRLGRLGASTLLLAALDDAAEADLILAAVLDNHVDRCDLAEQPLGWSVLTHRLADLILWAVLGHLVHGSNQAIPSSTSTSTTSGLCWPHDAVSLSTTPPRLGRSSTVSRSWTVTGSPRSRGRN